MAWSWLQSKSAQTANAATLGVTYTSNLTAGTKLIAAVCVFGKTTSTVKDGAGNAFTELASLGLNNLTTAGELSLWAIDTPAGDAGTAPTITATFSASTSAALVIQEVSGLAAGSTLAAMIDGTPGSNAGNESGAANQQLTSPSYSSTASNEYLVALFGDSGFSNETFTVPAGFTADTHNNNNSGDADCGVAYANSSNGAESGGYKVNTASTTATNAYAQILCAFKLAGAAAVTGPVVVSALPGRTWRRLFRHPQAALGAPSAPTAPVYPLGHPVQARQFPQQGGHATSRRGTFAQLGPPVTPPHGPVKGQPAVPFRTGRAASRAGTFAQLGPPVRAPQGPVAAKGRGLPPRGRVTSRAGLFAQLGAPVRPPQGPVHAAQPLPPRGRAQSHAGTFTAGAAQAGPPVYPLGHPVQAKRLPQRGGSAATRRGTFAQAGPPVTPAHGPVQAKASLTRSLGRAASRAGTFTAGAPQAGPPVYPLGHPVRIRPQPPPRGRVVKAAGTYAGTGPPAVPLQQPVSAARRPLPPRGRAQSLRGPYAGTGPPVRPPQGPVSAARRPLPPRGRTAGLVGPYAGTGAPAVPLRRPVRGQPQRPFLAGRVSGRAGAFSGPPPFTIGTLTAGDKGTSVLTATGAASVLTATTAPSSTITASDQRTGGPS